MPDGPPAAPRLADLKFRQNNFSSKLNIGTAGKSGMGSRGLAGRLFSSRRVSLFPGANSAPSNACRPEESSPNWITLVLSKSVRFS